MHGTGKTYMPTPALAIEISPTWNFEDWTLRMLRCLHALDVLCFQTLFTGYDFKGNFIAFVEGFESRPDDGRVMHEDILTGTLGDKPESLFVVEPLNFAASHIRS
jgi:hypothetical protein